MQRTLSTVGSVLLLLSTSLIAVATSPPPNVPVNRWFNEPEVHLPGWNVQASGPILTFPLRWAVMIRGEANVRSAKLDGHDLHFFVRVGDREGHWYPQRRYSSIGNLAKGTDVTVTERFFAKPGDYIVALVVYDATSGAHGLWKRHVHVPELEVPVTYPEASAVQFIDLDEPFKAGSAPSLPPIRNSRPLRLDIVLNLTERSDLEVKPHSVPEPPRRRRRGWGIFSVPPEWQMGRSRQDFVTEALLSIGDELSAVKVNGCTRISVVDAVRANVLVDRRDSYDPNLLLQNIRDRRATHKIDAHVLVLRQEAGAFLHDFFQTVIQDNTGCGSQVSPSERAIVFVSDALVFPNSHQLTPLSPPPAEPPTKFYFFRMTIFEYVQQIGINRTSATASVPDDQVNRLLSSLEVRRFDLSTPKDLQKALPKFLVALNH